MICVKKPFIFFVGLTESLIFACLNIFFFIWTPALKAQNPDVDVSEVFTLFMMAFMAGGSSFRAIYTFFNSDSLKVAKVVSFLSLLAYALIYFSFSYQMTLKRSGVDKTNTKIILSVGNAKFASTGKKGREKNSGGVPTNGKHKIMVRVAKAMGYDFKYMQVDEFRTTMCCYKCEQRMKDVYDEQGNVVLLRLGLKKCVHCQDTEKNNSFKLRNRDLNAALNMWRITEAVLADEERPSYLKRSPKRSRADTAELGGPHNSEYACNWQA